MATGTVITSGINRVNLLSKSNASFGTTYSFDSSGYTLLEVWVNQSGYRDCRVMSRSLFAGAYLMSIGGRGNSVKVTISSTSILVEKLDSSIGNNYDFHIVAFR